MKKAMLTWRHLPWDMQDACHIQEQVQVVVAVRHLRCCICNRLFIRAVKLHNIQPPAAAALHVV